MPQGKGTYGSKKGRPPKKIKRVNEKKTGFVKAAKSIERRGTTGKKVLRQQQKKQSEQAER